MGAKSLLTFFPTKKVSFEMHNFSGQNEHLFKVLKKYVNEVNDGF